ncbi:MAG: hypothetical protein ACRDD7_02730, partial [Peptostreptococcaceae bacterium]
LANNKDGSFDVEIANLSTEINTKLARVEIVLRDIEVLKDKSSNVDVKLKDITSSMQLENATDSKGKIFNEELLEELHSLTIEGNIEDATYFTSTSLYDYYTEELARRHRDYIDIEVTSQGFLDNMIIAKGMQWDNYIECGNFIYLEEIDDKGKLKADKTMRIVEYTIDGRNEEIKGIRLTDQDKQPDDFSGISNLVQNVARGNGYVNRNKEYWKESPNINSYYNKVMTDGMDLMATSIRSKSNRVKFNQTEAGMYIIDAINEDKQIYLGGGFLAFTSDRWMTSKVGLDYEGIVASEIYGRLILGQKLIITSEFGDLIIGNIENSPSKAFGIQIKEGDFERIFIGTELDGQGVRRAIFRLVGKDGGLNISEDGILSEIQFNNDSNVDVNAPLPIKARLRNNVSSIKDGLLTISLLPFRVHSKGVASGGQVATGFTSNSGGGASSGGGGGYYKSENKTSTAQQTPNGNYPSNLVGGTSEGLAYSGEALSSKYHYHEVWLSLEHWHTTNVTVNIPNHTHWCYDHTHYTSVNIPSHTHEESKGCYDIANTKPSNVRVVVNGTTVRSGINGDIEINIGAYLLKDRINEIYLYSDTLGSIQTNLSIQYFKQW